MSQVAEAVVRRTIVVDAPIEKAFAVFTERFGDFKPPEHNMLRVPIAETVFEPRVGGHIYDRGTDGSECRWARVLVYDPPQRVVFSWDIGPTWQVEADPDERERGRDPVRRREPGADARRARAPQHRSARSGLGSRPGRRRPRPGMAALPRPVRRPVHEWELTHRSFKYSNEHLTRRTAAASVKPWVIDRRRMRCLTRSPE